MKSLILAMFACLVSYASAAPGGVHAGTVITGPSGIVTSHGPIGPAALGLDGYGAYAGYAGHGAAYTNHGAGAYVAAPAVSHASIVGPAAGLGLGYGAGAGHIAGFGGYAGDAIYGGYGSGLGLSHGVAVTNGGGTIGVSAHGVSVKGPSTVPATIAGPAGKVVADGLYGVPTHGHGW